MSKPETSKLTQSSIASVVVSVGEVTKPSQQQTENTPTFVHRVDTTTKIPSQSFEPFSVAKYKLNYSVSAKNSIHNKNHNSRSTKIQGYIQKLEKESSENENNDYLEM